MYKDFKIIYDLRKKDFLDNWVQFKSGERFILLQLHCRQKYHNLDDSEWS